MAKRTLPQQQGPKKKSKNSVKNSHKFRCQDILMEDSSANPTTLLNMTVNSSGYSFRNICLAPMGITIPGMSVNGSGALAISNANYDTPHLSWFRNTSQNFQKYRILSATLIVQGETVGSTTLGNVNIWSSSDATDVTSYTSSNLGSDSKSRTFPLAQLVSKSVRVPLNFDGGWKKISAFTHYQGNEAGVVSGNLAIVNTVNDLSFAGVGLSITGATSSNGQNPIVYTLEYDVEFTQPIAPFVNR